MKHQREPIDWSKLRQRLQATEEALDRALTPGASRLQDIYRQRAEQLANRRATAPETSAGVRLLQFQVHGERYALELSEILEVAPFARCTPLPAAPPGLCGVMNFHGEIRTILELTHFLRAAKDANAPATGHVIFLRGAMRPLGLRVETVDRIRTVPSDQLMAPDESEAGLTSRLVRALGPDRLRLLDLDAVLAGLDGLHEPRVSQA